MVGRHLRQLIRGRVFSPWDIHSPEVVEAPLQLPDLLDVWRHLRARVLLVHLLDD